MHPPEHSAGMEKLGNFVAEAPWSLWGDYRGVLMLATTVIDMCIMQEGIQISTLSDLAD